MSQAHTWTPTTGTVSGLALSNTFNTAFQAVQSMNSGTSAPTNDISGSAVIGQLWLDTTASPYKMKCFDGTSWVAIGSIDTSNHLWAPPIGGGAASLASAGTVDLGSNPDAFINITGTTTITSLGSSAVTGTIKFLKFAAALTLTYNATSLIIPGAASKVTTAGDTAIAIALGGGNWQIVNYGRASGESLKWFPVTNYANLAAAVAAAGTAGGGFVYIPANTTCALGGTPITMPSGGNVWIIGDGWTSVVTQTAGNIAFNNTTGQGVNGGLGTNNNAFINFCVTYTSQGTGPGGTNPSSGGIAFWSTGWVALFKGLKIVGAYIGIAAVGPSAENNNTIIQDCWIWDSTYMGIMLQNMANVRVLDTAIFCSSTNLNALMSQAGIYLWGSNQGHIIRGCNVYGGAGRGLWARTSVAAGISVNFSFSQVVCNYFDSFLLDGVWFDYPYGIRFADNWISCGRGSPGGAGLVMGGGANHGDQNTISGNLIINGGNQGILLGSKLTSIQGNTVANNNFNVNGASGIEVSAGVTDFCIMGNVCGAATPIGTGVQTYPILVDSGASDRYIIRGNLLTGSNTNVAVHDLGSGTNKDVGGNF